jgi:hypothetical protein
MARLDRLYASKKRPPRFIGAASLRTHFLSYHFWQVNGEKVQNHSGLDYFPLVGYENAARPTDDSNKPSTDHENGVTLRMEKVKMRPHHLFCLRFLKGEFPERGERYRLADAKIKELLLKEDDVRLEAAEGIDELCLSCTNLGDGGCQSPPGGEEAVRKWDHLLLKGLGIPYGEAMSAGQWRSLIALKAPLDFCRQRCPKKSSCTVSEAGGRTANP